MIHNYLQNSEGELVTKANQKPSQDRDCLERVASITVATVLFVIQQGTG